MRECAGAGSRSLPTFQRISNICGNYGMSSTAVCLAVCTVSMKILPNMLTEAAHKTNYELYSQFESLWMATEDTTVAANDVNMVLAYARGCAHDVNNSKTFINFSFIENFPPVYWYRLPTLLAQRWICICMRKFDPLPLSLYSLPGFFFLFLQFRLESCWCCWTYFTRFKLWIQWCVTHTNTHGTAHRNCRFHNITAETTNVDTVPNRFSTSSRLTEKILPSMAAASAVTQTHTHSHFNSFHFDFCRLFRLTIFVDSRPCAHFFQFSIEVWARHVEEYVFSAQVTSLTIFKKGDKQRKEREKNGPLKWMATLFFIILFSRVPFNRIDDGMQEPFKTKYLFPLRFTARTTHSATRLAETKIKCVTAELMNERKNCWHQSLTYALLMDSQTGETSETNKRGETIQNPLFHGDTPCVSTRLMFNGIPRFFFVRIRLNWKFNFAFWAKHSRRASVECRVSHTASRTMHAAPTTYAIQSN